MEQQKDVVAVPHERIANKIFLIRGKKVMFDSDLAELYEVETKVLNQAIRRNKERFPNDFMFQLTKPEWDIWHTHLLRSQTVTSKRGGRRYAPYVFTEQGVAMLSSVLNSTRAIQVNIQIIRTFTKLREMMSSYTDLRKKIEDIEKKYDSRFKVVFEALARLSQNRQKHKKSNGASLCGHRDQGVRCRVVEVFFSNSFWTGAKISLFSARAVRTSSTMVHRHFLQFVKATGAGYQPGHCYDAFVLDLYQGRLLS